MSELDFSELAGEATRLTTDPQNRDFLKNFVKMPAQSGAVTVCILSALPDRNPVTEFYCSTRTHRLGQKNIHCPCKFANGKWAGACPICDYYRWLYSEAD